MTIEKNILKIVPGLQATALLGENVKLFEKMKTKSLVKVGVKNLVGVGLIGATAKAVNTIK